MRHGLFPGSQGREEPAHPPELRPEEILLALVELVFAVQGDEQVAEVPHGLGGPEEEHPSWVQRVVEEGDDLSLQLAVQVDEEIAAADEVELGEGGVLDDVLLGEDEEVADVLVNPVGGAVGLLREEAGEPLRGEVGGDAGRVEADPGLGDGPAVDVRGEELHVVVLPELLHPLQQKNGERVRLFAGGAARRPDPDRGPWRLPLEELGDDPLLQGRERLGIAEKAGHADEEVVEERLHLQRGLLQEFDVPLHGLDLMDGHPPLDPPPDRVRLVEGEVMARMGTEEHEDLFQHPLGFGGRHGFEVKMSAEGARRIIDELGRHLGRRQHVVHQTGGDGAPGHAVVFGGFGVLGHDHPPLPLDGPHPQGAVAPRAGEDDADRPLQLVLGEGAEEEVDGEALAPRRGGLDELERAVQAGHVAVGGDDVGAVGFDGHAVRHLEDLHPGVAPDQVGEDALVVRGQVLDQDEGHPRVPVGGHGGKKRLEGGQSPRRGADADDGEAGGRSLNRLTGGGNAAVFLRLTLPGTLRRRRALPGLFGARGHGSVLSGVKVGRDVLCAIHEGFREKRKLFQHYATLPELAR